MLTLTLMRHANSGWGDEGQPDFDRTLDKRGRKDAPEMGAYMRQQNISPDLILCSAALRTRETYELLNTQANFSSEVRFMDELYLINEAQLMKLLYTFTDEFNHICVIAHNPGIHEMVVNLVSMGSMERLASLGSDFPTSSIVVFEFDIKCWSELMQRSGKVIAFSTPALLSTTQNIV
ncbi:MAG: SixA phosphatase family protein [Methyloligellaceae bacterium]